jgi:hypothetical protein
MIDALNMETLQRVSSGQRCFFLDEVPDAAPYIKRMTTFKALKLPYNCFYLQKSCMAHRISRIIIHGIRLDDHVGDTHAIAFVGQQYQKKRELQAAARELISSELDVQFGPPPSQIAAHTDRLLHHSFGRLEGIVRGRVVDGEAFSEGRRHSSKMNAQKVACKTFLNGDPRFPITQHYEQGCCVDAEGNFSREVCIDNCTAAACNSGVVASAQSGLPSKARWGSLSEHEAEQCAGEMLFQLGPRAMSSAFQAFGAADPGLSTDDDYRRYVRGKVYRAVQVSNEDDYGWSKCTRSYVTEPADHLLMRLEYLDEHGNSVNDICYDKTSPIRELHDSYATMLNEPVLEGPMRAVIFQFWPAGVEIYNKIISEIRHLAIEIDSQVWFWLDQASGFPNRWTQAYDERRSEPERARIFQEGWDRLI